MARPPSLPTNPEERHAARLRRGLPHISEQRSIVPPHPRHGGSRGYTEEFREQELRRFENREPITVSLATIYRWRRNGIERRIQTGNHRAGLLTGEYQFLLSICKLMFPVASIRQIRVFIATFASTPIIFSTSSISRALTRMGYTRKKHSTLAYQACTPENRAMCQVFFSAVFLTLHYMLVQPSHRST
uniref:Uncharacterized protein n=1 Tax=Leptocylindrus danicus TaxID=163516 RepID=A0A7S2K246_9STRA|mmetsp:Transcript_15335/g.22634  ORF Transcript_15335/g.22634 Transcript_15335/m.22634 type:complete len:188 (+) Transcript_15335:61-624(+)